ncbi:MAG: hypothetical protein HC804_01480 [Anaerolineae bacterium]|nr:hypothetical protein [Anaerolineae bacterium]
MLGRGHPRLPVATAVVPTVPHVFASHQPVFCVGSNGWGAISGWGTAEEL